MTVLTYVFVPASAFYGAKVLARKQYVRPCFIVLNMIKFKSCILYHLNFSVICIVLSQFLFCALKFHEMFLRLDEIPKLLDL